MYIKLNIYVRSELIIVYTHCLSTYQLTKVKDDDDCSPWVWFCDVTYDNSKCKDGKPQRISISLILEKCTPLHGDDSGVRLLFA